MTSYSTSFRYWEGTPGDPSIANAWGSPLSTNFTLLEATLGGSGSPAAVSVAGQSNVTLTTQNGATDQARALAQQYTGALTQNCTVNLPNVPRVGYAINSATGGFNIILQAGSGTTFTVPPDGNWYFYQTDGSGNVAAPVVKFSAGAAGPIIGTTGTFSSTVSMPSLTAITGTFSGTVTGATGNFGGVTGTSLTLSGALTAGSELLNGTLTMPNNTPIIMRDNSTTLRNVLYIGSDNWTNLANGGGTGVRFINQAQTVQLFACDNAGNVSVAGVLTVPGTCTLGTVNANVSNITTLGATNLTIGSVANINTANIATLGATSLNASSAILGNTNVSGNVQVTGTVSAASFITTSDARIKANITDITEDEGCAWVWRGRPRRYTVDGKPSAGFVAQEDLESGRGEAVLSVPDDDPRVSYATKHTMPATRLARDYNQDIAYLTAALQSALRRIDDLEAEAD